MNKLENSENILKQENLSYVLNYFGYSESFLIKYDDKIDKLITLFIDSVIYVKTNQVISHYSQINEFSKNIQKNILYSPIMLCDLIFAMYNGKSIEFLISNIHYLTDKYQAIGNTYLGQYYLQELDFNTAKDFFNIAQQNIIKDNSYEDMYHYFLSSYYMMKNDHYLYQKNKTEALELFSKSANYLRMLNLNIQNGTEHIFIGNYSKALEELQKALVQAKEQNCAFEEYIILHNQAFVYMLQNRYDEAVECYNHIPLEQLTQKNCHAYIISLTNIGNCEKAIEICQLGISLSDNEYYKNFFDAYTLYFTHNNLSDLTERIEKIIKKHKNCISDLEIQFLHVLIAYFYKKLRSYKKSVEHLEEYIDLLTKAESIK